MTVHIREITDRSAEAEQISRNNLAILEQKLGPMHPQVAGGLNNLAGLLQATNRLGEAEVMMRRALAINEESYGLMHPLVAIRLNNLSGLLYATNRLVEAEPMMRQAVGILLRFTVETGHLHPHLRKVLMGYAELCSEMGVSKTKYAARGVAIALEVGMSGDKLKKIRDSVFGRG